MSEGEGWSTCLTWTLKAEMDWWKMSMEGLVWVIELNREVRRCMKPFVVALTLFLGTMNRPGYKG